MDRRAFARGHEPPERHRAATCDPIWRRRRAATSVAASATAIHDEPPRGSGEARSHAQPFEPGAGEADAGTSRPASGCGVATAASTIGSGGDDDGEDDGDDAADADADEDGNGDDDADTDADGDADGAPPRFAASSSLMSSAAYAISVVRLQRPA
jgi:hypothetical protein